MPCADALRSPAEILKKQYQVLADDTIAAIGDWINGISGKLAECKIAKNDRVTRALRFQAAAKLRGRQDAAFYEAIFEYGLAKTHPHEQKPFEDYRFYAGLLQGTNNEHVLSELKTGLAYTGMFAHGCALALKGTRDPEAIKLLYTTGLRATSTPYAAAALAGTRDIEAQRTRARFDQTDKVLY